MPFIPKDKEKSVDYAKQNELYEIKKCFMINLNILRCDEEILSFYQNTFDPNNPYEFDFFIPNLYYIYKYHNELNNDDDPCL